MTIVEVEAKLAELEHRIIALEMPTFRLQTKVDGARKLSLREFLNEKKPTTANDRTLCIAYYGETVNGAETFNTDDIKAGFREARIPLPRNPNDVINKNISKAYIMVADQAKEGKRAWVLTATGIEAIEKGFGSGK